MTPAERGIAEQYFGLLARGLGGDRAALGEFVGAFADDGVLWSPPAPDARSPCVGRDAILGQLLARLAQIAPQGLAIRHCHTLEATPGGPARIAFQFAAHGLRRDGSQCLESPLIALALRGGRIAGLWEYRGGPHFFDDPAAGRAAQDAAVAEARALAERGFLALQRGLAGERDQMAGFLALLAEDVRVWFPPTPNTASPYVGRAAAVSIFRDFLGALYPEGLFVRRFHTLCGGERSAFELQSFGVRRDGSEYINSPVLSLDVHEGRIVRIWEHWGAPGCFDPALRVRSIA